MVGGGGDDVQQPGVGDVGNEPERQEGVGPPGRLVKELDLPRIEPAKALASAQPPKDQTSQGGEVTRIRRASMMKPVTMIPKRSRSATASSAVLSGFP